MVDDEDIVDQLTEEEVQEVGITLRHYIVD